MSVLSLKNLILSSQLKVSVFNRDTNEPTDLPLDIKIMVDDVNDNAPTFKDPLQFTVLEQSNAGAPYNPVILQYLTFNVGDN